MPSLITAENLFTEYKDTVYRYAYSVLWNKEEAEDITSQTFLTALKKLDKAQEYQKHATWLIQIARNHIGNKWQKKGASYYIEADEEIAEWEDTSSPTPEDLSEASELRDELFNALSILPPEQRLIIVFKHWENLSNEEVAAALDMKVNTVKVYYQRALHRLQQYLKEKRKRRVLPGVLFATLNQINQIEGFTTNLNRDKLNNSSHMFKSLSSRVWLGVGSFMVVGLLVGGISWWMLRNTAPNTNVITSPTPTALPSQIVTEVPSPPVSPTPTGTPAIESKTSNLSVWEYRSSTDSYDRKTTFYATHRASYKVATSSNHNKESSTAKMTINMGKAILAVSFIRPSGLEGPNYPDLEGEKINYEIVSQPSGGETTIRINHGLNSKSQKVRYSYTYLKTGDECAYPGAEEPLPATRNCADGPFMELSSVELLVDKTVTGKDLQTLLQEADEIVMSMGSKV